MPPQGSLAHVLGGLVLSFPFTDHKARRSGRVGFFSTLNTLSFRWWRQRLSAASPNCLPCRPLASFLLPVFFHCRTVGILLVLPRASARGENAFRQAVQDVDNFVPVRPVCDTRHPSFRSVDSLAWHCQDRVVVYFLFTGSYLLISFLLTGSYPAQGTG